MSGSAYSDWPIIVGGCHRSGTSLVRRILDSHSRIHCGPEVKLFAELYGERRYDPAWVIRFIPTARTLIGDDELLEVLGPALVALHERAAGAAGKSRWADKVPENVLHLPRWQRLLGDEWLFIHVVRNPLDTIVSLREARFIDVPSDLTAQVIHYRRYFEAGLRFSSEHPERSQTLVYERLVEHAEGTVAEMMRLLGEQLEPRQLAINAQPHQPGVEDFKVTVTTGVKRDSVNRWRSALAPADAELVWELTRDLWAQVDPDGRLVSAPQSAEQPAPG
jgi:hypothetical protein